MSKMKDLMKQAGVSKDTQRHLGDFFGGTKLGKELEEDDDYDPVMDMTEEELDIEVGAAIGMTKEEVVPTVQEVLNAELPEIELPSVHSGAVLVHMHVSQWTARKKDNKASKEVTDTKGAEQGAASVHKNILHGCAELEAIKRFVAGNRHENRAMTLPWEGKGVSLLPTANFMDFHNYITGLQAEFNRLCEEFYSVYEWERVQAEAKLGDLFDRNEYPPLDVIRQKFHFTVVYSPVPDSGNFILDIQQEAQDIITEHCDSHYSRGVQEAMCSLWKDLYAPLANMSKRLDHVERKDGTYRDTLVDNVMDIVHKMRDYNITNDPQVAACSAKLEEILHGVTTDALKEDVTLRAQTKRSVDEVLATLPSMDF